jgi:hypothetical protein
MSEIDQNNVGSRLKRILVKMLENGRYYMGKCWKIVENRGN